MEWTPEKWLSYATDQLLNGEIAINTLKVENLWLPKGNIFESIIIIMAYTVCEYGHLTNDKSHGIQFYDTMLIEIKNVFILYLLFFF